MMEDSGSQPKKAYRRRTIDDAKRWRELYWQRISILKIAKEEGVDPQTVSSWLKKLGLEIGSGQHFVEQPPLKLGTELVALLERGPVEVWKLVQSRIWGVQLSEVGNSQLQKFCKFIQLHRAGAGVKEIAQELSVHRTTVAKWRAASDLPYGVKLALMALRPPQAGWKWLPKEVGAGGNDLQDWTAVPSHVGSFDGELRPMIEGLRPTKEALARAVTLGWSVQQIENLRFEFFGYLLGVMVGDAAKEGGLMTRLASSNIDFQLTMKKVSNERFGEIICLCVNQLGISMGRTKDKPPTGATLKARDPSFAFRWVSGRSPMIAWIYSVCLGLGFEDRTSYERVSMPWMLTAPREIRRRFIQGLADSDGTVKSSGSVEIVSVPNSEFVVEVLKSLGLNSAHVIVEGGKPIRTKVSSREAWNLPMFNEWLQSYRYQRLGSAQENFPTRDCTRV